MMLFSTVAFWPLEEDLLVATDFGDTQHAEGEFEPVMYLSLDSYALVSAAPRVPAERVLDICCGSGVQGIVALRYYAEYATFQDLNPRALRFSRFNAFLNGFGGVPPLLKQIFAMQTCQPASQSFPFRPFWQIRLLCQTQTIRPLQLGRCTLEVVEMASWCLVQSLPMALPG